MLQSFLDWFAGGSSGAHHGGSTRYMDLIHCMGNDYLWIGITVGLDVLVAAGYLLIARHWWVNARRLEKSHPAYRPLANLRNIFLFCGLCGYLFIPVKMVWPAWRLYDLFMVSLVYFTWNYALRARGLKVIYTELGRTAKLEHDLDAAKAESKRKSFFLNSVSHDLRTPLNGIVLQAAVAEMSLKQNDPEMLRETLEQMKVTAKVAADLLNSFLELGRLDWEVEKTTVTEFDLADLLRDVVTRLAPDAERKQISLRNDLLLPSLKVRTDRVKLGRILDNLAGNAVKFTERGHVAVTAETRGTDLTITVSDTGPGISPDHVRKLFDEFYQVQNDERNYAKGFGLGLAIARKLADHLGATITVDSELGRGSRFAVVLPGAIAEAVPGRHHGQLADPAPVAAG
jgi:signal transduction histidine kinase